MIKKKKKINKDENLKIYSKTLDFFFLFNDISIQPHGHDKECVVKISLKIWFKGINTN